MAARAKKENTSNAISSITTGRISNKHSRIVPWDVLYQNWSNFSALLHKMATRTKYRKQTNKQQKKKKKKTTSNDIFSITSGRISIKLDWIISQDVLYQICSNRSAPLHKNAARAKLEWTSNDIFSVTTGWISTKVDWIVPWAVLYLNCSNRSAPLHKMAVRAKTEKKKLRRNYLADFNQTWQDCSLGGSLPKLLKSFCSAAQNGHQS